MLFLCHRCSKALSDPPLTSPLSINFLFSASQLSAITAWATTFLESCFCFSNKRQCGIGEISPAIWAFKPQLCHLLVASVLSIGKPGRVAVRMRNILSLQFLGEGVEEGNIFPFAKFTWIYKHHLKVYFSFFPKQFLFQTCLSICSSIILPAIQAENLSYWTFLCSSSAVLTSYKILPFFFLLPHPSVIFQNVIVGQLQTFVGWSQISLYHFTLLCQNPQWVCISYGIKSKFLSIY